MKEKRELVTRHLILIMRKELKEGIQLMELSMALRV